MTTDGKYLDSAALRLALRRRLGSKFMDDSVKKALAATERLLLTVDACVAAAIAGTAFLTLHELEHLFVLQTRDFEGVSRLVDAGLGNLARHPRVATAFQLPPAVLAGAPPPELTSADVARHLAVAYEAYDAEVYKVRENSTQSLGRAQRPQFNVTAALEELAASRNMDSAHDLCVRINPLSTTMTKLMLGKSGWCVIPPPAPPD